MQDQIREIDAGLAALPSGELFAAARANLEAKKAELKKAITTAKPLHQQIESCAGAAARAAKRRDMAREARDAAERQLRDSENALGEAEQQLVDINQELARLERTLASSVAPAPTPPSSLDALRVSMEGVIAEMSTAAVDQSQVQQTQALMSTLFGGLQAIAAQAQQAAPPQQLPQGQTVLDMLQANAASPAQVFPQTGWSGEAFPAVPASPVLEQTGAVGAVGS